MGSLVATTCRRKRHGATAPPRVRQRPLLGHAGSATRSWSRVTSESRLGSLVVQRDGRLVGGLSQLMSRERFWWRERRLCNCSRCVAASRRAPCARSESTRLSQPSPVSPGACTQLRPRGVATLTRRPRVVWLQRATRGDGIQRVKPGRNAHRCRFLGEKLAPS